MCLLSENLDFDLVSPSSNCSLPAMLNFRFPLLLVLLVTLSSLSVSGQEEPLNEPDLTSRPAPEKGPTEVTVRMIILNLEQIHGADQTFTADVAFEANWQDDRLRHSGSEKTTMDLSDIWNPDFQIVNRQKIQFMFPEDADISPDGNVRIIQRVWGQFSQPLQLRDFPFDVQTLHTTIVSVGYDEGMLKLKEDSANASAVADSFSIPDWKVLGWDSEVTERPIMSGGPKLPTFEVSITMKRESRYYFINVILPLFLIICMSWIVFWLPSSQLGPRVSVSVTAMLTLTAYRFAIGTSLPKVAYLTRLDWLILGSSLLVFLSLVEVIVTTWMAENGRAPLARRINHSMRAVAPILFLLIAYASLYSG